MWKSGIWRVKKKKKRTFWLIQFAITMHNLKLALWSTVTYAELLPHFSLTRLGIFSVQSATAYMSSYTHCLQDLPWFNVSLNEKAILFKGFAHHIKNQYTNSHAFLFNKSAQFQLFWTRQHGMNASVDNKVHLLLSMLQIAS